MAQIVTFILTGPNAGKTIELGGYQFKNGACNVCVTGLDNANQPLPSVDTLRDGDRADNNEQAGIANVSRVLKRFYGAYPESELVHNADGTYSLPEGTTA